MSLPVADAHVDVLYKLLFDDALSFVSDSSLQASLQNLESANIRTQVFAVYVPTRYAGSTQLEFVLQSIDLFHRKVVSARGSNVLPVTSRSSLLEARQAGGIAGILSLEGGGCLGNDTSILRVLFELGVRGAGLTWNPANQLADGCREERNAGLTQLGKEIVREMQRLGMWVDIAHLADSGVRDVLSITDGPIMASHANVRNVHEHPRNLTDETIREIIRRDGWMGLTFEGAFVAPPESRDVDAVFQHLDYVLELGGENHLGFGSDFDGTSNPVSGLATAADYGPLRDAMVERYGKQLTEKILFNNFEAFLQRVLP